MGYNLANNKLMKEDIEISKFYLNVTEKASTEVFLVIALKLKRFDHESYDKK